jgi:hypothetical protein
LRFQIEQEVRYKVALYRDGLVDIGTGKTLHISSREITFTTESPISVGLPVELSVNWPALLDNSCRMQLRVHGCVIGSTDRRAVVAIERYEFRTQRVSSLPPNSGPPRETTV